MRVPTSNLAVLCALALLEAGCRSAPSAQAGLFAATGLEVRVEEFSRQQAAGGGLDPLPTHVGGGQTLRGEFRLVQRELGDPPTRRGPMGKGAA